MKPKFISDFHAKNGFMNKIGVHSVWTNTVKIVSYDSYETNEFRGKRNDEEKKITINLIRNWNYTRSTTT